jgi:hypothetical protein
MVSDHSLTMARPVTISDEQILDAARAVFTEKGPRATTAEIAERAGVSEGIRRSPGRTSFAATSSNTKTTA